MKRKGWKMAVRAFLLALLLPTQALAQEGDEIRVDETGVVTLVSKEAAGTGVSSLQVGLRVDSAEGEKVGFLFDESKAKLLEFRYDEKAKQWNLYLAGTEALFAAGEDTLILGRVTVVDGSGEAAAATVSIVEDSVRYVYGTELRSINALKLPEPRVINEKAQADSDEEDDEEEAGEEENTQGGTGGGTVPAAPGIGSQGTGSTPKPAASTPGPSGPATAAPGDGSQGAGSTPKPAGSGTGTTPAALGDGSQNASPAASPQESAGGTAALSSGVQLVNGDAVGKEAEKNGIGMIWVIAVIVIAAVFGIEIAVLVRTVRRRKSGKADKRRDRR